ncbi:MAG TPA: HNH endonuclease [Acidobacteriota bacterium]|nr:HNH endonuclease [Acidobacteriota bacterium]
MGTPPRTPNTDSQGRPFSDEVVQAVWEKGQPIAGISPSQRRRDSCGAIIDRSFFGRRKTPFGWEIDHVRPLSQGGSDALDNLQPLHWMNNRAKGDDYPEWNCELTAS